ncbi:hypothetical protein Hanom_Chr11g01014531 [Helianthus anomalus]
MTGMIIMENISVPTLWVMRMMLGRMSRKARPVVREKNGDDAPLWIMFCPDFKCEVAIVSCEDSEEGFNRTIRDNFRLPDRVALEAVLPQGKGIVFWMETHRRSGALGRPCCSGCSQ